MSESIVVTSARTEDLSPAIRAYFIDVCVAAHQEDSFRRLFSYIPAGGRHFLAYRDRELVSHAVVTTRWLKADGQPDLKTVYVDAVATLPVYQGRGIGSALMRHLASALSDYAIACLETERVSFYAQLGWEEWRGLLAGKKGAEIIPTPDQKGIMILRLPQTPAIDLDSSLTIEYDGRFW